MPPRPERRLKGERRVLHEQPHGQKARAQGNRKTLMRPLKAEDMGKTIPIEAKENLTRAVNTIIASVMRNQSVSRENAIIRIAKTDPVWNEPFEHNGIEGQLIYDIKQNKFFWSSTRRTATKDRRKT